MNLPEAEEKIGAWLSQENLRKWFFSRPGFFLIFGFVVWYDLWISEFLLNITLMSYEHGRFVDVGVIYGHTGLLYKSLTVVKDGVFIGIVWIALYILTDQRK